MAALNVTSHQDSAPPHRLPRFDHLAQVYVWLEILTFGAALQRCRTRLLPELAPAATALILGDGDGRGLAALLQQQPWLAATAIDLSPAMLGELRHRCTSLASDLTTLAGDALPVLRSLPRDARFDLITSHFFLDCLDGAELSRIVDEVSARSPPSAQWLLSEFQIPVGWRGLPARAVVGALYLIFGALTGMRVRKLPDHTGPLLRSGWTRTRAAHSVGGLLTTELWERSPRPDPAL